MRISNIANHRFLENYKNDPRVPGLAQIARMCFLIMHRCVMDMQRHRNHYFLNLHTPFTPLKKDGSSKICWKSHFSKSIFLLILRVGWTVNGTKMEFKISSVFLSHSLACFLDVFSIVFFLEHSEYKKDGSSKIFWKPHFSNCFISSILNVIWAFDGSKL